MNSYVLSKEESERFNILKFIAIIFVVYIHSYATDVKFADGTSTLLMPNWLLLFENLVSQVIARCGVPLFFLISAILLYQKPRNYAATLKNKAKTILLPYFIWNSLWVLAFILLQIVPFTAPYFSGNKTPILQSSPKQWLELYGIGWPLPQPHDYPLWFMRDLMLATLFFPLIGKLADKFPKPLFIAAAVLYIIPVSFPLKQALLWFCFGACIVKLQIHITLLDHIALWKIVPVYILLALVALLVNHDITDSLFIFAGVPFWVRVSKSVYDAQKLKTVCLRLAKWTFIIYVAHELTLSSLRKVCMRLFPATPVWLLAEYILLPIVVITGCSIAGAILKKIAPRIYAIATGAR